MVASVLQVIELPIKHPELFESLGVAQPKASTSIQCQPSFLRKEKNLHRPLNAQCLLLSAHRKQTGVSQEPCA